MPVARTERIALADTFAHSPPDAPTLCEGWDAADLLAHLLVRERRPDASAGMAVRRLAGHLDSVSTLYRTLPWDRQLELLRSGPPRWNPMGWGKLDALTNGVEFFVHHEDLRRGGDGWKPRELDDATVDELIGLLRSRASGFPLRSARRGVLAQLPDGRQITLNRGTPPVILAGEPGEVLLWIFGRDACEVDVSGDPDAIAAVTTARRGG